MKSSGGRGQFPVVCKNVCSSCRSLLIRLIMCCLHRTTLLDLPHRVDCRTAHLRHEKMLQNTRIDPTGEQEQQEVGGTEFTDHDLQSHEPMQSQSAITQQDIIAPRTSATIAAHGQRENKTEIRASTSSPATDDDKVKLQDDAGDGKLGTSATTKEAEHTRTRAKEQLMNATSSQISTAAASSQHGHTNNQNHSTTATRAQPSPHTSSSPHESARIRKRHDYYKSYDKRHSHHPNTGTKFHQLHPLNLLFQRADNASNSSNDTCACDANSTNGSNASNATNCTCDEPVAATEDEAAWVSIFEEIGALCFAKVSY